MVKSTEHWTTFQVDAEVDSFGTGRVVEAHNELLFKYKQAMEKISLLEGISGKVK